MQMYEVGGCVRDAMLGRNSKDIDFSVVLEPGDFPEPGTVVSMPSPYEVMVSKLEEMGVRIFKDDGVPVGADFFTARGRYMPYPWASMKFPELDKYEGRALDFVLARKDGEYSDGRRPDSVELGTLEDDLARRDFTMNAMAKAADGSLIDPFNGTGDIIRRIIVAVGDPAQRLQEDALRAVRAVRFAVTLDFFIDPYLRHAMEKEYVLHRLRNDISAERITEELQKMFRHDTVKSLRLLNEFPSLTSALFSGRVSLDATLKQKGRR